MSIPYWKWIIKNAHHTYQPYIRAQDIHGLSLEIEECKKKGNYARVFHFLCCTLSNARISMRHFINLFLINWPSVILPSSASLISTLNLNVFQSRMWVGCTSIWIIMCLCVCVCVRRRGEFFELTKNSQFVWEDEHHRDLLRWADRLKGKRVRKWCSLSPPQIRSCSHFKMLLTRVSDWDCYSSLTKCVKF